MDLVFYTGRDNTEDLVVLADGIPLTESELGAVTAVAIEAETVTISSADTPDAFDWPAAMTHRGEPAMGLRLELGNIGLPALAERARVILFDAEHPHGIVWATVHLYIDP